MNAKQKEEVKAMLDRIDANQLTNMKKILKIKEELSGEIAIGEVADLLIWMERMKAAGFLDFRIQELQPEDITEFEKQLKSGFGGCV